MTFASWFAVYFVLWWLCLFVVLPFGVRTQADAGEVLEGSEPGAPAMFRLWPRLLANSILTAVILVIVIWALSNPLVLAYWR